MILTVILVRNGDVLDEISRAGGKIKYSTGASRNIVESHANARRLTPVQALDELDGWSNGYLQIAQKQVDDQTAAYAAHEFCRNPLHPGPCKGWKNKKAGEPETGGDSVPAAVKKRPPRKAAKAAPAKVAPKAPTPVDTDAIDKELDLIDRTLADLAASAQGPRSVIEKSVQKIESERPLTDRDRDEIAAAERELSRLTEEGTELALRKIELLSARDGSPFGGSAEGMPTAEPVMVPVAGADMQSAAKARQEYVRKDVRTTTNNASLRSGSPSSAAKAWRSRMAQMVQSGRLSEDAVVYRGAALSPEMIMQLRPGAVITDQAFNSTDERRSSAEYYGKVRGELRPGQLVTIFTIKVPGGTRTYDANYGEFIFGPQVSMKILKTERTEKGVEVFAEMTSGGS